MRKKLMLSFCVIFLSILSLQAQKLKVTGKITSPEGKPIESVSIVEKGTKNGTLSGQDGVFTIEVQPGAKLTVTAVGYITSEVIASASMSVELKASELSLSEVVVTAMGIKREKKALGYAVSTVGEKDVALKSETDIGRLLSGKAPGVNILGSSGLSGSGTNIVIRGISSINGGTSIPLFIVDGVPFDASTNAQAGFDAGNQTSSRFLDLDPNNIESISVLKGLSATVIYGDLARNGVIVVTTKSGSSRPNKKLEISLSQSFFANKISSLPDYQSSYGGGFELAPSLAFSNWGAHFNNPPDSFTHPYARTSLNVAFPGYIGAKYSYEPYNSVETFFRTGLISTTSVGVAGGNGGTSFNAGYSYTSDEGFTPGNSVRRNNFNLGGRSKLSNNFTLSAAMNFALTDFVSPTTGTSFGSSASYPSVFGDLIYTPRSINLMGWPYENPLDGSSVYYRANNGIQNPRWTVKHSLNYQKTIRTFGNLGLQYDVPMVSGLSVNYKFGWDIYTEDNQLKVDKGGTSGGDQYIYGMYRTVNGTNSILDHSLYAHYTKDFSGGFNLYVDGGANLRQDKYSQSGMKSTQQLVYGLFNHGNFINHEAIGEGGNNLNYASEEKRFGLFVSSTVGYKDYIFLNLGGRESWVSTLEQDNRSIFYPSTSLSFVPTSAIAALQGNKIINYLKARVGYSTSARFPSAYNTRSAYYERTNAFVDRFGNKINYIGIPNSLPNPDLKPELLSEVEAGIEGTFLSNRISLDLTLYRRTTNDQILSRGLDPSTGYDAVTTNAGKVTNKGIEVALGLKVIKSRDFTWQIDANYTLNRSKVSDIPADIEQIIYAGYSNLGNAAINGMPLGVIIGSKVSRDATKGDQPVVGSDGLYIIDAETGVIGDPNPLYKLTGINTLSYKGFSFRMQWDYSVGGDMVSLTTASLLARGLTKETDFDRSLPLILPGVKQDGTANDIQISPTTLYFNTYFGANELQVWNATNIRLREVSLSYSIPAKYLSKMPFGSLSLTFSGQNLWYNAPNFPKYVNFDPETSSLGVSNGRGLEFLTGPSSRRFGGSLKVTF